MDSENEPEIYGTLSYAAAQALMKENQERTLAYLELRETTDRYGRRIQSLEGRLARRNGRIARLIRQIKRSSTQGVEGAPFGAVELRAGRRSLRVTIRSLKEYHAICDAVLKAIDEFSPP